MLRAYLLQRVRVRSGTEGQEGLGQRLYDLGFMISARASPYCRLEPIDADSRRKRLQQAGAPVAKTVPKTLHTEALTSSTLKPETLKSSTLKPKTLKS